MNYDKYGFCVKCGKNMIKLQVIDGRVQKRFLPDYKETEVLLDDGSIMRLATCQACKDSFTEKDYNKVMKKVIKGWEKELEDLPWEEKRKQDYMKTYSKREIVSVASDVPKDMLEQKFKEYKEKK